ncbi:MAG: hypothetical protein NC410_10530 [Oscillibacter sp.]|nr:hypothetical protein [Oscillibacter sp.]
MGIFLGIVFFMTVAGILFLLLMWGLWILGIAGDFLRGLYRAVFRKPGKISRRKPAVRITEETDLLDYAMCRKSRKYKVTVDLDPTK